MVVCGQSPHITEWWGLFAGPSPSPCHRLHQAAVWLLSGCGLAGQPRFNLEHVSLWEFPRLPAVWNQPPGLRRLQLCLMMW